MAAGSPAGLLSRWRDTSRARRPTQQRIPLLSPPAPPLQIKAKYTARGRFENLDHVVYVRLKQRLMKIRDVPKALGSDFDLQGHRGARGLYPENTREGFLLALRLGVTTLEMDVVVTRDRQVVLSHDPWFSSEFSALPSGVRVPAAEQFEHRIYDMPYETVCTYECGLPNARFPRQARARAVKPLLKDVIVEADAYADERGWPPPRYNVETKTRPEGDGLLHPPPSRVVDLLLDVIVSARAEARTIIQSFDPRTLRIVRERGSAAMTSLLVERKDHLGVEADLRILGFVPDVYSPDHRLVSGAIVEQARRRGMRVIPWTVNDASRAEWLVDTGVDGLITDYPDVVAEALGISPREAPPTLRPPRSP